MTRIVVALLSFYQATFSIFIRQLLGVSSVCRYSPSCSEYAKEAVKEFGVLKGGAMAFWRFLSCQPFVNRYHVR
mgnify:CR=1 FL=1